MVSLSDIQNRIHLGGDILVSHTWLKALFFFALLICLVNVALPVSAGAEFPICTNLAYQEYPGISGNIVVWDDYHNGNYNTYGYNLASGQEFSVCTAPGDQESSRVSGNIVVWNDSRNGNWDIYGYDLAAGREFPICTAPGNQGRPAVSGNIVVWEDGRNEPQWTGMDIYGYDLSTGQEFEVCTAPGFQECAAISGNIVVWEDDRYGYPYNHDYNIYGYDLATDQEFPVCTASGYQIEPSISGDIIVWCDRRSDNYDIYGYNLTTGSQFPISMQVYDQFVPSISGNTVIWMSNHSGNYDIYGCTLGGSEGGGTTSGPIISNFNTIPSILSSTVSVTASLTATGATRVNLQVKGLRYSQPPISMTWNGSAWVTTISANLVRWAQSSSLLLTATAYDSSGHTGSANLSLPVQQSEGGGGTTANSVWVDEKYSCGILDGSATVLGTSPLRARLRMDTAVKSLFSQYGSMNLWPAVTCYKSVDPANEISLGSALAHINRFSPAGGPSYDVTFNGIGDRFTFTARMDGWAYALGILDAACSAVGAWDGAPNALKTALQVSPSDTADVLNCFASLAPVTSACQRFNPAPKTAWAQAKATALAFNDLKELYTNPVESDALRLLIERIIRSAKHNPSFVLQKGSWEGPVGQALSYYGLLKIWRDWMIWGIAAYNGNPEISFEAEQAPSGANRILAATTLDSAALAREQQTVLSFDVSQIDGQTNYNFNLGNIGVDPIWEWRIDLDPEGPQPTTVTAPPGWQGEVVWDVLNHYVRWYTQGENGWASGDFGTATIAQDQSLSGFGFQLAQPLTSCAYSATDTSLRLDGAMQQMMPSLTAAPASFDPAADESARMVCYLDRLASASVSIYHDGVKYLELLPEGQQTVEELAVDWNGKDANNQLAPSGQYEAHLDLHYADGSQATLTAPIAVNSSTTGPIAPSDLSATATPTSQINLSWTDNSSDEIGFKIERKTGTDGIYTHVATVAANVQTYSDTSLTAGTLYYYQVRAYNDSGDSDYSNEASATTSPKIIYSLTTAASPTGSGSISGGGNYDSGTNATVQATPAAGYRFDHWSGDLTGSTNPTSLTMTANKNVTANFVLISYTLTTAASPTTGGSISGAGSYSSGANATLQAAPVAGYRFDHWSGDLSGNTNPTTISMSANKSVTANFIQQFTLSTSISPTGGGSVSGVGTYDTGTTVTVQATPAAGYIFSGWSGALSGSTNPTAVTMTTSKSIIANFTRITYTLTTAVSPAGSGSVSGAGSYNSGTNVTVQATPVTGYRFDYWSGDLSGSTNPMTIAMTGAKSVVANFSRTPAAPTGLTATALSSSQISLSWSFTGAATGFKIYRKTGSGAWGTSPIATVAGSARSYANTRLSAATNYTYRVCVYNSYGASAYSNEASATTMIYLPAPSSLAVTAISSNQVSLRWRDNSTNEGSFSIERRTGTTGAWSPVGTVGANTTSFTDTTVAPRTGYNYRVRALAGVAASAYSRAVTATTPIYLAPPTNLVATPVSSSQIRLTWNYTGTATGFRIYRKTGTGAWPTSPIATVAGSARSYTNSSLLRGTTYTYRIYAYYSTAKSAFSNEASATTSP